MTEMDDDREEFGPGASADDAGDPAAAFDALRETLENLAADLKREMTTIRKGVEAAFEEFDRHGPPQDYKPELAQIVQQLERQASDLERISNVLASHNKSAFHRKDQDFRMWMAGGIGFIAGAFLLALLPRFLPFSADSHVAGLVMGRDRFSAGRAMIEAADPKRAQDIVTGGWVYDTNRDTLDKCIADMFKTRKEQRCALTLPVVERNSSR